MSKMRKKLQKVNNSAFQVLIVNKGTNEKIDTREIKHVDSVYIDEYQGIKDIHGHKNETVIKILRKTLNKMLDDGYFPRNHQDENGDDNGLTTTYPHKKKIERYAFDLYNLLDSAMGIKDDYHWDNGDINIYWYVSNAEEIIKYYSDDGEVSDGLYDD
jgi:hypothetical protein